MPRSLELEVEMVSARAKKPKAKTRKGSIEGRPDFCPKRKPAAKTESTLKGTVPYCPPVDVCGQRYRIRVDREYANDKGEGFCTWADNVIEVLEQAEDRMHDSILHEIVHAIYDACGLKWDVANALPHLSKKERRMLEEMVCRHLAPALLATLRNAGWLSMPAWPPKKRASR